MVKKLPTRKVQGASTKKKAPKKKKTPTTTHTKYVGGSETRRSAGSSAILLPQKVSEPPEKLLDYTLFLYGKKGVGKTSMLAQFPDITIFEWEPRRRNVRCRQIPKPGEAALTWERWRDYQELLLEKPCRIGTDTLDRAWKSCVTWMLGQWKVKRPNDLPGNERMGFWAEAKIELATSYEELLEAGCDLLFSSHYKRVTVNPRDGDSFDEWEPGCGAAWDLVKEICDVVMFYYYRRGERTITIRGTELLYATPGPEGRFLDPDGNPLIEFEVSSSTPKQAYKDLHDAFANKVYGFVDEEPEELEEEE